MAIQMIKQGNHLNLLHHQNIITIFFFFLTFFPFRIIAQSFILNQYFYFHFKFNFVNFFKDPSFIIFNDYNKYYLLLNYYKIYFSQDLFLSDIFFFYCYYFLINRFLFIFFLIFFMMICFYQILSFFLNIFNNFIIKF